MRIHIDRTGLVCSLGRTSSEVYRSMCAGEARFRVLRWFEGGDTPEEAACGGRIDPGLEDSLRESDWSLDLAGHLARAAAGQTEDGRFAAGERTGLVLATNFGPMEHQQWLWQELIDRGCVSQETRSQVDGFGEELARDLGCGGPLAQISMSCASGGCALQVARDMLERDRADQVLAVAFDALAEYSWYGLHNLHTITRKGMCPFDADRSGTIFSEGAAAVLVSREGHPVAGRPPYFITGIATGNNASHLTAPLPGGEGSRRVMERALRDAGLAPGDIEHVCAHATSTQANDRTEAAALRALFGRERLAAITVAAHKSQLGHLQGAACLAETIVTLEAMKNSVIPPNLTLRNLDPECEGIDSIPGQARYRRFDRALINSAGIGGNNCAIVLERLREE